MIIKKFVGKTESDAVEAAKKELGNGVVVMNVRDVKKKGIAALFAAKQVEITVALEEERDVQRPTVQKDTSKLETQVRATQTAVNVVSESSQNIEKKLDSLQTLLVSRFQQSEMERGESESSDESSSSDKEEPAEEVTEQDRFIRLLYNTMLDSEVDEKYANQIVDDIDKTRKPNLPFDYILANVYQKMILMFSRAEGITPAEKGPKIVMFMGPTGVGKTTTIAKIASSFVMEQKKKVVLLTADTYRIAAAEQLRTYANILEIPFRVIYSEEDARIAVRDFRESDYIFVDTMGHSHQNEEQLDNMKKLLKEMKEAGECQSFLVLSAATKYRDLVKIAASYKTITDYQLIFTKLDETATLGNLMNIKLFTETPIAYVTYGQNVPSDIEVFNPQKTVKQLLSTKQEKTS